MRLWMIRIYLGLLLIIVPIVGMTAQTVSLPFTVLSGEWKQSHWLSVQLTNAQSVSIDGKPLVIDEQGRSIFGIARDATEVHIHWIDQQGRSYTQSHPVIARAYHVQRINGLPNNKVNPNPKELAEIKANNQQIAQVRAHPRRLEMPQLPFIWPTSGVISSVWGSQRILNGEPRRPHFGVDIAAAAGTPIYAPADGRVVLVHPSMLLTGKTLMLDHGLGLMSIYIHMSDISVVDGDQVKQGQLIGYVGQTGRATGPHLHWGMTWRDVQIDASYLTGQEASYGMHVTSKHP